MGYWRGLIVCVLLISLIIAVNSFYYGYNPCKSGYFLRNPYTGRPFFCTKYCPWPRFYSCESMTGNDDGWGVCCFKIGDV